MNEKESVRSSCERVLLLSLKHYLLDVCIPDVINTMKQDVNVINIAEERKEEEAILTDQDINMVFGWAIYILSEEEIY